MTRSRLGAWLIAAAFVFAAQQAGAQAGSGTVRVAPSGSDSVGCGSIASPCQSLQFAVEEFGTETDGRILVAAGTYTSTDPRQVVRVTQGRNLIIEGGYTTAFDQAAPDTNVVTIDGQNARRGITVDPTPMMRDPQLTLRGVTLSGGAAPPELGTNTLSAFGGGIDVFQATVTLIDVIVSNNQALALDASSGLPGNASGGGISLRQCSAFLSDVTVDTNLAEGGDGSGTAVRGGLGVGGGIFAFESRVTLNDVRGTNNTAQGGNAPSANGDSGGQRADGLGGFWALILSRGSGAAWVAMATRRSAAQRPPSPGSGSAAPSSSSNPSRRSPSSRRSSTTTRPRAATPPARPGPGRRRRHLLVRRLPDRARERDRREPRGRRHRPSFGGDGAGAGIYMDSVQPGDGGLTAINTVIAGNDAVAGSGPTPGVAFGGGIFFQCPRGGGVCDETTASNNATLSHVTLADNSVSGATFNQGAAFYASADVGVTSDFGIISGHTTPITTDDRGEAIIAFASVTLTRTLWDDNTRKSFAVPPDGVFVDDFASTGSPNYVAPMATPANYRIAAGSAAIDAATGSTTPGDLDREARGGSPDLGADEFLASPAPMSFGTGLIATVFEDGRLLAVDSATGTGTEIGSGPDQRGEADELRHAPLRGLG